MEAQQAGEPVAAAQEQRGLLPPGGYDGHDWRPRLQSETGEPLAIVELDPIALPYRPVNLPGAAGVDEHRRARRECGSCDLRARGHGAEAAQQEEPRRLDD